ncbi:helix-turn-helix domain-containing protein [Kangiella shandongensis]|uniref:helix-turn-helix domain-containing protein n=1 Tax=Kangiella shandongensis TaxID=2763258 RepID=UPI001CBFB3FC|nr:helix-turn-helix domain-containing protein [Kangiella shandongensis]
MSATLSLRLLKPQGKLSQHIQGVWSASIPSQESDGIKQWLKGDVCSGVIFNFGNGIVLNDKIYHQKLLYLPVTTQSHSISLMPGANLAGIRFHPGIGFDYLGAYDQLPTATIDNEKGQLFKDLYYQLQSVQGHYGKIGAMYRWLLTIMPVCDLSVTQLQRFLNEIKVIKPLGQIQKNFPMSQRQLERQFKKRVGVTAKEYQRIQRVRNVLEQLKVEPETNLVDLALNNGFSDQSHMTRECKRIALITPKRYKEAVVRNGPVSTSPR